MKTKMKIRVLGLLAMALLFPATLCGQKLHRYVVEVVTEPVERVVKVEKLINGDSRVDEADMTVIGNPNPSFTYGFSTSLRWKTLTLALMFDGVYGNQIANGNLLPETNTAPLGNNLHNVRTEAYFDAWSETNPDGRYPRLNRTAGQSKDFTDRIVEDGSYMRRSSASLSYQFNFKKNSFIKGLNLSFTVRNALLWTSYSGWDPEVSSFTNDALKVGVDWSSYPSARSYVCGISMTF